MSPDVVETNVAPPPYTPPPPPYQPHSTCRPYHVLAILLVLNTLVQCIALVVLAVLDWPSHLGIRDATEKMALLHKDIETLFGAFGPDR